MSSNTFLVLGPVVALGVSRVFGPWRVIPTLAIAVVGQLIVFVGYVVWRRSQTREGLLATQSQPVAVAVIKPTIRGRVTSLGFVIGIAIAIALIVLTLQFLLVHASAWIAPAV